MDLTFGAKIFLVLYSTPLALLNRFPRRLSADNLLSGKLILFHEHDVIYLVLFSFSEMKTERGSFIVEVQFLSILISYPHYYIRYSVSFR